MVVMVIETFVLTSLPSRIQRASWSLFETLRSSIKLSNVVILNRIFSMSSVSYYFVSRKVDVLLNQTMYFTPPLLQLKPHTQLHGYT